jgi:hypothetical protein
VAKAEGTSEASDAIDLGGGTAALGVFEASQAKGIGFLMQMPPGRHLDTLVQNVLRNSAIRNPKDAFIAATMITRDADRRAALKAVYRDVEEAHPGAAWEILQGARIPPSDMEVVRQSFQGSSENFVAKSGPHFGC